MSYSTLDEQRETRLVIDHPADGLPPATRIPESEPSDKTVHFREQPLQVRLTPLVEAVRAIADWNELQPQHVRAPGLRTPAWSTGSTVQDVEEVVRGDRAHGDVRVRAGGICLIELLREHAHGFLADACAGARARWGTVVGVERVGARCPEPNWDTLLGYGGCSRAPDVWVDPLRHLWDERGRRGCGQRPGLSGGRVCLVEIVQSAGQVVVRIEEALPCAVFLDISLEIHLEPRKRLATMSGGYG